MMDVRRFLTTLVACALVALLAQTEGCTSNTAVPCGSGTCSSGETCCDNQQCLSSGVQCCNRGNATVCPSSGYACCPITASNRTGCCAVAGGGASSSGGSSGSSGSSGGTSGDIGLPCTTGAHPAWMDSECTVVETCKYCSVRTCVRATQQGCCTGADTPSEFFPCQCNGTGCAAAAQSAAQRCGC